MNNADRYRIHAHPAKHATAPFLGHVAISAVLIVASTSPAQNLQFLKDSAVSYFDERDTKLMMQAVDAALDDPADHAVREWKNDKTANSGKSEVLGSFVGSKGSPCKRLRVTNLAHNGVEGRSTYSLCKQDGTWMIASENPPAK